MRRFAVLVILAACGGKPPAQAATPSPSPAPLPAAPTAQPAAARPDEPKMIVTYDKDCHELCMEQGGDDISCQAECAYSVPADSEFGVCMTECMSTESEASCDARCR